MPVGHSHPQGRLEDIARALAAAALFGASTPLARVLAGRVHPVMLAALLYLGSGAGLGVVALARRGRSREAAITRADLPWLAGVVLAGGVLGPVLLMAAVRTTPATTASLLLNLEGVFTAALAWTVFRENVDRRVALGMAAIVAGGALLAWQGGALHTGGTGPLLVVGACACWALDNNLTQKLSARDPVHIAAVKGAVAGTVNLAAAVALGAPRPGLGPLAGTMAVGMVGYGASLVLFVGALRSLGAARTGAYFAAAPFVGAALSVVFLHEALGPWTLGAAGLMAVGVALHVSERHTHPHEHSALAHEHRHAHDAHHQHAHPPGLDPSEPHSHAHAHEGLAHEHPHDPDLHHRHGHG